MVNWYLREADSLDSKITMSGVEHIKWQALDGSYPDNTMTLGVSGETSTVTNRMYVGTLADDTLTTGQGQYVEGYGADGDDTITVTGSSSWVTGDAGHDTLIGGSGNDTLKGDYTSGFAGNDTLIGNAGDDTLEGNADNDTLTGGAGSDTFHFSKGFGNDVITDFEEGVDKLTYSGYTQAEWDGAVEHITRWSPSSNFVDGATLEIRKINTVDISGPELVSISIRDKTLEVGDTLYIDYVATDETGIGSSTQLNYRTPKGGNDTITVFDIDLDGVFELEITENFASGDYTFFQQIFRSLG